MDAELVKWREGIGIAPANRRTIVPSSAPRMTEPLTAMAFGATATSTRKQRLLKLRVASRSASRKNPLTSWRRSTLIASSLPFSYTWSYELPKTAKEVVKTLALNSVPSTTNARARAIS